MANGIPSVVLAVVLLSVAAHASLNKAGETMPYGMSAQFLGQQGQMQPQAFPQQFMNPQGGQGMMPNNEMMFSNPNGQQLMNQNSMNMGEQTPGTQTPMMPTQNDFGAIESMAQKQESTHTQLMEQVTNYVQGERELANNLALAIRKKATHLQTVLASISAKANDIKRVKTDMGEKEALQAQIQRQMDRLKLKMKTLENEMVRDNTERSTTSQSENGVSQNYNTDTKEYDDLIGQKKGLEDDIMRLRDEYRKVQGRFAKLNNLPLAKLPAASEMEGGGGVMQTPEKYIDSNGYYPDGLKDSNSHPAHVGIKPPTMELQEEIPPQGIIPH